MSSMFDPPRDDTTPTIAEAQFLALQAKMLTTHTHTHPTLQLLSVNFIEY